MRKKLDKNSSLIALLELNPTDYGVFNGNPAFNEFSISRLPSRAIDRFRAILEEKGYRVVVINPLYDGYNGRLTTENLRTLFSADLVGISPLTRTSPQSMRFAEIYRSIRPNGILVAGGQDPTARQDEWLNYVDFVARKEAWKSFPALVDRLTQDPDNVDGIKGIASRKNGEIVSSDPDFLTPGELSSLPHPKYTEKTRRGVSVPTLDTTLGCPYNCPYCGVTDFFGGTYRIKQHDYVADELKMLYDLNIGNWIFIIDDNFAGNRAAAKKRLETFIDRGLTKRPMMAQVSIEAAKDHELLKLMRKANLRTVFVGFENNNPETLAYLGIPFNPKENDEAAMTFREYGLWVHGMLMLGGYDTKESLRELGEWAKKRLHSVQYFSIVLIHGTPFYFNNEHLILTRDYSLWDGFHVVIRPLRMRAIELQDNLEDLYYDFYSPRNNAERLYRSIREGILPKSAFGIMMYTNVFGGLRRVLKSEPMIRHKELLRAIS